MSRICTVCGGRLVTRIRDGREAQFCTNLSHDKIAAQRAAGQRRVAGRGRGTPPPVVPRNCPVCGTPMRRVRGGGVTRKWKWQCENPRHDANVARNRAAAGKKGGETRKARGWQPKFPHPKPRVRDRGKKDG
jgi:hypothetical protein